MISVIPAQPEPSNGVCRPRFFNCFWDIPTTMERYVHVTSKSLVDAVQPFEQSHGNVDILTPFWCKNGVQNRACCQSRTASSFLIPVCVDGAGRRLECHSLLLSLCKCIYSQRCIDHAALEGIHYSVPQKRSAVYSDLEMFTQWV